MIRDQKLWQEWEKEYLKKERVDFVQNLELLDAMYEEARALKLFSSRDPLEGLEIKIELARAVNVSKAA
jgi:hypothetical protein